MLNFFKKEKKFQLFAPISGNVCPISEAADPVFAEKIVGDGVFINAEDTQIVAPCAGEISFVAETKHAFAMGAAVCIYIIAWKNGIKPVRVILAGVAVSAFLGSGISGLMIFYSDRVHEATKVILVAGINLTKARTTSFIKILENW